MEAVVEISDMEGSTTRAGAGEWIMMSSDTGRQLSMLTKVPAQSADRRCDRHLRPILECYPRCMRTRPSVFCVESQPSSPAAVTAGGSSRYQSPNVHVGSRPSFLEKRTEIALAHPDRVARANVRELAFLPQTIDRRRAHPQPCGNFTRGQVRPDESGPTPPGLWTCLHH
jgi:hypothetical protein